ncbi:MAG: hypothetical protein ACYTG0_47730 [Planctomycetota bacterium]|jgi:tetratricopeptide (TPR) repeat protein
MDFRRAERAALVVITVLAGTAAASARGKIPVPDAAAQTKAQELVREIYGKEHEAAKTSARQLALARRLFDEGARAKGDPAGHFVLLRFAKDMAVQAGDAETALEAVDRIVEVFEVDVIPAKVECLEAVAKSVKSSSQHAALAEQTFSLVDAAVAKDNFEAARRLGEIARESARRARNYTLVKRIVARSKAVKEFEEAYAEYQKAMARLEDDPTDPDANFSAGQYLCLVKGDWEKGIPMLALGSDQDLKNLAVKELEGTASPEAWVALADGWWEFAAGCEGSEKDAFLRHAGKLYEKALPSLSSTLLRARLTKRLDEVAALRSSDGPIRGRENVPLPESPVLGVDLKHEVARITTVDHVLQIWMILPEYSQPGRYQMSIKHALAGDAGAFYMTVWTDLDGDGVPDTEMARSPKMVATANGQWSTWKFLSKADRVYVGNFTEGKKTQIYYTTNPPAGYRGLSTTVYVSRSHRTPPNDKANPRCTNIRVQRIK